VTLPSRRASIRPEYLDGARVERPRQNKIARAVSWSPERRAIIVISYFSNCIFFIIILYVGQPAGKQPEEWEEESFCDHQHGAHGLRDESGGSAWGSGQRRVAGGIRPLPLKEGKSPRISCLGPESRSPVGATLRGRRTNDLPPEDHRWQGHRNSDFRIIGAVTAPDTALPRGALIPRVSRRYWPRIRAPLRAGLTPLSTLDRKIQGFILVRALAAYSRLS